MTALSPGRTVESYEVREVIGRGAFGITYGVIDKTLGLRFALKEYFPEGLARRDARGDVTASPEEANAFAAGLEQFLKEGQTLARLDHPGLGRVLRHFSAAGTAWLLMPWYEGKNLHQLLLREGTFNPAETDALLTPLLDALEYLQARQVVHGDIKPSNIIVQPDGQPVLLDFGAARVLSPGLDAEGPVAGSKGYAAPEQGQSGAAIGPATDVYGLAATLYRLLTGAIPAPAPARLAAAKDPLERLEQGAGQARWAAFRPGFLRAVDQGLALEPSRRPRDISRWRKALVPAAAGRRSARAGAQVGANDEAKVRTSDREERVLLPGLLAGAALLALLATTLWLVLAPGGGTGLPPAPPAETSLPSTSLANDDASWEQAVRTDSAAGFRAYLEAFPRGRHVEAAREQLAAFDQQFWERVRGAGSVSDLEAYLEAFPDGRFGVEAQARLALLQEAAEREAAAAAERATADDAAYTRALSAGTIEALDNYLAAWPGGRNVAPALEAKAAIERAQRDDAAWASALDLDQKAGYEAYVRAHPSGAHLAAAIAAIDRLTLDPGKRFRDCAACPEMVVIPPGSFQQGAAADDPLARSNERPLHQVRIDRPFAIGLREVSFAEWDLCVADGACRAQPVDNGWGRADRPVMLVNWVDASAYVTWLSQRTGAVYRLPSESEWEYAARAGEAGPWVGGNAEQVCALGNVAGEESAFKWRHGACADPFSVGTAPAGYFAPNAFGVFDMVGNVAEWTDDCMNLSYLDAPADGSAWSRGLCSTRVTRGGGWFSGSQEIRLSARFPLRSGERNDFTGFRVLREIEP